MKNKEIKTTIGYFEKKRLVKSGRNDAKKGVVYIDNNVINSPFIEKELTLCIAKMQNEYESFLKIKSNHQKALLETQLEKSKTVLNIKEANKRLEQAQYNIDTLNEKYNMTPDVIGINPDLLLGEEMFSENSSEIREFRKIENQAPVEVERARFIKKREELFNSIDKLPLEISTLQNKIEEISAFENKQDNNLKIEFDIYITRCKQHYAVTIARINEYWNGVLQCKKQSEEFKFVDNQLIYGKLQKDINQLTDYKMEMKK